MCRPCALSAIAVATGGLSAQAVESSEFVWTHSGIKGPSRVAQIVPVCCRCKKRAGGLSQPGLSGLSRGVVCVSEYSRTIPPAAKNRPSPVARRKGEQTLTQRRGTQWE